MTRNTCPVAAFDIKTIYIATLVLTTLAVVAAGAVNTHPFETDKPFRRQNKIDTIVMKTFKAEDIQPADRCSDSVFIRRAYLDLIGTLPTAEEVDNFLQNPRSDKRKTLVNVLLKRDEFAKYRSLKWCDLLRVKAEFPINLWPDAVQAYHRWIKQSIAENMPYDQFVSELLTSSGSNFHVPQVNFYRAIQGKDASTIAKVVALNFMGVRLENWSKKKQEDLAKFFTQVSFKGTAEWKEEIVSLDPTFDKPIRAVFPDGKSVTIQPGTDPRKVFADWLIKTDNEWFSRNIVNRIWSWLMGRGMIHPTDDIRPDNKPVHPELLAYLSQELVESNYDLKHIYRLILNSSTYQQSSICRTNHPDAEALFACYPVRQLDAEVLIDALCLISNTNEKYSSPIPEPFTFIPENQRSIDLADGSITSQFLEMFGRPSRDTGFESERTNKPTDAQRRHMLNSSHIQSKIDRSWRLRSGTPQNAKSARGNRGTPFSRGGSGRIVNKIYLSVLSRYPTDSELKVMEDYYKSDGISPGNAASDLMWALINSKEFLYRH
ncbi:MAG: DUF1553 domain-containing protein [Anaerohalosphaera sp.]|nr:DUF1553 domain-containing protein [Anaerohalosphaera sp.]